MAVNVCAVTHLGTLAEKLLGGNGSRSKSLFSQVMKGIKETRGEKGAKSFHFTFLFVQIPCKRDEDELQIGSATSERCVKSKWKWQEER